MKKKILLVADVPGWAFDNIANAMIKHLGHKFNFTKIFSPQYRQGMSKCFDHVYFLQWNDFIGRGKPEEFIALISSHNYYLIHDDIYRQIIPKFKAVATASQELYDKIKLLNPNTFCVPHGVDHKLFTPQPCFGGKKLVIGCVGRGSDPNATLTKPPYDMKGHKYVLNNVIKKLQHHPDIEFKINNKSWRDALPLSQMPSFYKDIHIQLCTSFREGTPCPAFEAAAMARAIISTRVGCIPQLVKHGENGLLVDSYDNTTEASHRADEIVDHILFLKNNRDLCRDMGIRSREIIEESWTWKDRAKQYVPLFQS